VYYRFTTLLGLFCGTRYSAGFATKKWRTSFYRAGIPRPRFEPEWRCFFSLVSPLGVVENATVPVDLSLRPADLDQAAALLGPLPENARRIALVPGSSPNWPEKKWPLEFFAKLMEKFTTTGPVQFFIFGDRSEAGLGKDLQALRPQCTVVNCAGRTTFPVLAAALKKMDLCVANDTGPMHCAALMGVPTVGIFGPTTEKKWSPPGRFRAVVADCTCRPCYYLSSMPECGDRICLRNVTADMVFDACMKVLENRE
jgi:ADP-heptose:LPS heptosyltransferase